GQALLRVLLLQPGSGPRHGRLRQPRRAPAAGLDAGEAVEPVPRPALGEGAGREGLATRPRRSGRTVGADVEDGSPALLESAGDPSFLPAIFLRIAPSGGSCQTPSVLCPPS